MGLVIMVLLVGATTAAAQSGAPDRGFDEIARVNGVVITRREFQVEYRQAVDQHAREGQPVNEAYIASVRRTVIQRMVEEELLYQESQKLGIVVSAEEIDAEVAAARARFQDGAEFEQELSRLHMDETQYRRKLHRQRAVARAIERLVTPSISVSEEEIRQFYDANAKRYQIPEKIRLSHIVIRIPPGENPEDQTATRLKIEMIKKRLDQGEDFGLLARQYTEEPRREQGGDVGYVQRGQLPPQLDAAAFVLEVGENSPILVTPQGFHLIRVTDRQPKKVITFENARPDIRRTLLKLKRDRALRLVIDSLRQKSDIRASQ
jgi:peptidyl-prolyl cis-trans isomerase C